MALPFKKHADGEATALPQISVPSQPAQDKNTLPGMVPPIAYTKVNASTPPVPDAGAGQQKAQPPLGAQMLPKLASSFSSREDRPMNTTPRPLVQDLVKQAMESATQRTKIAAEGARQMKLAEERCEKCGKGPCECKKEGEKKASASLEDSAFVTTEYALKLASAIEYAAPIMVAEMSKKAAPNAPPPHFSEKVQQPPEGVLVSNVKGTTPGPGQQGHGHATTPMHPGSQKGLPAEHGATQVENTLGHHVSGTQTTAMSGGQGKTAAAKPTPEGNLSVLRKLAGEDEKGDIKGLENAKKDIAKVEEHEKKEEKEAGAKLVDNFLAHIKQAEDAINPAQISAGPAVPPDTSAAGEPGGAPLGGKPPSGSAGLVGSNQAAIDYKKGTAYAPRKSELAAYFTEPALSSATDKTLNEAFSHTGEAGVKISAAGMAKAAAARALLSNLAESSKTASTPKQA